MQSMVKRCYLALERNTDYFPTVFSIYFFKPAHFAGMEFCWEPLFPVAIQGSKLKRTANWDKY